MFLLHYHSTNPRLNRRGFFDKKEVPALFGLVKIHCTRSAVIARVEIGPRQRHDEHGEHQNNSGNDDGGFCWHGYASFFGSGAMVMLKPQRWQRWTTLFSVLVACIATWQTGQVFGGFGRCSMSA